MNYTTMKIITILAGTIFTVIGLGALIIVFREGSYDALIIGVGGVSIGLGMMYVQLKKINKFQSHNYGWYRATNPSNVKGNAITCFSCGSGRIHARGLMNHYYTREHFCTQCGTTLYYSPESQ